jgi:hypothetical protein
MIAAVALVVIVGAVGVTRFMLWRSRGQVMAVIDGERSAPTDLGALTPDELGRQHTYYVTVRDTYFGKPRTAGRAPERAAWVQARITQIQEQHARNTADPGASD